ncbi:LexA family protein [Proteus mirabilis]|uniref:LexA family protein n=1 Tax=Proteus mirabilis TaxID=584 RepID=UPI0006688011|nr:XRE family transcriptional regulator [Proteus mirabilis]
MNIDDNFKNRIQLVRQSLGLTQGDLADKVGVVRRQIAAYEAGDSKPRINVLNNLAATLGATAEWLAQGIGVPPEIGRVRSTITLPLIPILTFTQAANLPSDDNMVGYDYIPAPRLASDTAFAVRIDGDSMQSNSAITFPEGSIVIFDPELDANNGDFILCKLDSSNDATFKQLIIDQGEYYLHSLNPKYMNMLVSKKLTILGVAIESRKELSPDIIMLSRSGMISNFMENISDKDTKKEIESKKDSISGRLDKIESMLEKLVANSTQQNDK